MIKKNTYTSEFFGSGNALMVAKTDLGRQGAENTNCCDEIAVGNHLKKLGNKLGTVFSRYEIEVI